MKSHIFKFLMGLVFTTSAQAQREVKYFKTEALVQEIKEQTKRMNIVREQFLNDAQAPLNKFWIEVKKEAFLKAAYRVNDALKEIKSRADFSTDTAVSAGLISEYAMALTLGNEAQRTVVGFLQDHKTRLFSTQHTLRLIDYADLPKHEMVKLLKTYKGEIETTIDAYGAPLQFDDLAKIEQRLANGQMNEFGLRGALGLAQHASGNIAFEMVDAITNEWQLKAFNELLGYMYRWHAVMTYPSQKDYAGIIRYADSQEHLRVFSIVMQLENARNPLRGDADGYKSYLSMMPQDSELLGLLEKNKIKIDAFVQIVKLQNLLWRLGINTRSTYINLLNKIENDFQLKTLEQIVKLESIILPYDVAHDEVEHYIKKKPFSEKVGDVIFGVNTDYLYGKRTKTNTSYRSSELNRELLSSLIFAIGNIQSEQDNLRYQEAFANYLQSIENNEDRTLHPVLRPLAKGPLTCSQNFGGK